MSRSLPAKPSLRYLKEEAKDLLKAKRAGDLLKAKRAGDVSCCATLRTLHRLESSSDAEVLAADVSLQEVQFALALDYGFTAWDHLVKALRLRAHVVERVASEPGSRQAYWDRFGSPEGLGDTPEDKVQSLLADPQWLDLAATEQAVSPLSEPFQEIRRQIANMERCHGAYMQILLDVLDMIGTMTPGRVLDCGDPGERERADAAGYARAMESWLAGGGPVADDRYAQNVAGRLGEPDQRKTELVGHLAAKLRDQDHQVAGVEGYDSIEAHIHHLEPCVVDLGVNVQLVLDEICQGQPLVKWEYPGGLTSCGTCPRRGDELRPVLEDVCAWIAGDAPGTGQWSSRLGEPTDEKRWLAACLCEHAAAMHQAACSEELPRVALASGVSVSTINRIANGRSNCTPKTRSRILKGLNKIADRECSPEDVFPGLNAPGHQG